MPATRSFLTSALIIAAGLASTIALTIVTQVSMLMSQPGWKLSNFRGYFAGDQLSYFAIVINGSQGRFAAVEPFTETGTINYPHLYYSLLGAVSYVTGVTPAATWSVVGICFIVLLTVSVSIAAVLMTRNRWFAFVGPIPLVIGTLSTFISGTWMTLLDSHAVLWGPFAVLFTLNGEAASLSVAGVALLAVLVLAVRAPSTRVWLIVGIAAAAVVGLLGNVQTYAFLTSVYVLCYTVAAFGLSRRPRRSLIALSGGLVVALFFVGPLVAPALGQLATLTLGLVPAIPGLILVLVRTRGLLAIPAVALALAASPQIIGTYLATKAGDPFLAYRVASSKNLGVPLHLGLLCAMVLLVLLAYIAVVGFRRRDVFLRSYPIAIVTVWFVVAGNDSWGANQEPYRFWIDMFVFTAVTSVPLFGYAAYLVLRNRPEITRKGWAVRIVATVLPVALIGVSLVDWSSFYRYGETEVIGLSFQSERQRAASEAVAAADAMVLTDPCLDPLHFKANTGAAIVYYNGGMAWPADKPAILGLLRLRNEGVLPSQAVLQNADVNWVITDDSCAVDWAEDGSGYLERVSSGSYAEAGGTVTLTLWRVNEN
ncbi:hypothetical protein QMG83_08775 [Salinibacterium sp. G-O1]|uniref:hypothetical protein n=1 Tax=Salinibacterium sp. G-O1 TaxID=3046208 RepID=UPI0024B9B268|nr:hypothetical protein [Salinibacterium sp. G-O1]MDJ0335314.1 hypothetical protein [Salinibacterium sp. G-O1]